MNHSGQKMKLNNEPNNWAGEREPLGTTIVKQWEKVLQR